MWSTAVYDLALTPEYFYSITPRMYRQLMESRKAAIWRQEYMLGQLTACVVNFGFRRPKKALEPEAFMPSEWGKKGGVKLKRERMTRRKRERIASKVCALFAGAVEITK